MGLLSRRFLALFTLLLVMPLVGITATGGYVAPADARLVRPLPVGAKAPAFTARLPDGNAFQFDPATRKGPAVIIFYRGGWCPYCNAHLGSFKAAEGTLRARGYEVMFLSMDRPEILRTSLKDDVENEVAKYTLLSDASANAARAFRVAFRVDDDTYNKYKGFGIDLEAASGEKHHLLPVPAVYVIDRRGTVRFVYYNADYKVRLSADKLLAAAP
jgi:peroxiredoxin